MICNLSKVFILANYCSFGISDLNRNSVEFDDLKLSTSENEKELNMVQFLNKNRSSLLAFHINST